MTVKAGSAVEQLTWYYEHPFAQAVERDRAGIPVAGLTSNTVPWELLRAAGFYPVMLNPPRRPAPLADRFMEDGVFGARILGSLMVLPVPKVGGDSANVRAGTQALSVSALDGPAGICEAAAGAVSI